MVKVFVVTHKPTPIITNSLYTPIQVNTEKNELINPTILTDNDGDNISKKNDNFCELTATYWITKNIKNIDIIGLCHYRRYFNFYYNRLSLSPSSQKRISSQKIKQHPIYKTNAEEQSKKIKQILSNYDIILPYPSVAKKNGKKIPLSKLYEIEHRKSDFDETKKIILEKYPSYKNSIATYLDNNSNFHAANMLITQKKHWDNYHNWLFDILFELEKRIKIPKDQYQKRVFGFISERLLTLYFYHNNFKIKKIPLIKVED